MAESTEKTLIDEVLTDAKRQAERTLQSARQDADSILTTARQHAANLKMNILDAARQKLDHDRGLLLADLPHQRQIHSLQTKEDVLTTLFDQALTALRSRRGYDIVASLTELAVQGISELGGDAFTLELAPPDVQALGERLRDNVAARVQQATGKKPPLTVVASASIADGGVIIRSANGRIMIDNSFATRLRRARQALRTDIAQMLFGDNAE